MPSRISEAALNWHEPFTVPKKVDRIAIIGGGASGAITLDALRQEDSFKEIVVFERRNILGGIWVLDPEPIKTPSEIVKPGRLSKDIDPPLKNPFDDHSATRIRKLWSRQERFEQTPAYEGMATNIIENLMTFSDEKLWIANLENKYVDRSAVRDYIERYLKRSELDDKVKIVLETTVEEVIKVNGEFQLTLRHRLQDGTDEWYQQTFDAVIVNVGHYHVPYIPEVPGLAEVQQSYPESIQHAKFFRNAEPYTDKVVIVVGSRALGSDLVKYSADKAAHVYQLIRNTQTAKKTKRTNISSKPIITKYIKTDHGFDVVFKDGSIVSNPDVVVYATGYQFLYPFLSKAYGDILLDGRIVPDLYQHTFYLKDPLLTFVGVPTDAISFRAFEYQAILVSRYLAGKVALPSRNEQKKWLDSRLKEKGVTRAYHTIGPLDALRFVQTLTELGEIKGSSNTGRQFPQLTAKEVEQYVATGLKLAEFWDMPRVAINN